MVELKRETVAYDRKWKFNSRNIILEVGKNKYKKSLTKDTKIER